MEEHVQVQTRSLGKARSDLRENSQIHGSSKCANHLSFGKPAFVYATAFVEIHWQT
jgi:hypothetical protein